MKKQLIIVSALFIGFSSQCSLYDRMKAKATSLKKSATSMYQSARQQVSKYVSPEAQQAIKNFAQQNSATLQRAQDIAIAIAKEKILPEVLSAMKEPVGRVMSQGAKFSRQKLIEMGISPEIIDKFKNPAVQNFEKVFGAKEEEDSAQQEWVEEMYRKQREATTEEERAIYTKKLQDFFDGEQGQAFALRHMEE